MVSIVFDSLFVIKLHCPELFVNFDSTKFIYVLNLKIKVSCIFTTRFTN